MRMSKSYSELFPVVINVSDSAESATFSKIRDAAPQLSTSCKVRSCVPKKMILVGVLESPTILLLFYISPIDSKKHPSKFASSLKYCNIQYASFGDAGGLSCFSAKISLL